MLERPRGYEVDGVRESGSLGFFKAQADTPRPLINESTKAVLESYDLPAMPLKPWIAIEELSLDGGDRFGIAKHAGIESRNIGPFSVLSHHPEERRSTPWS